jgi:hypothetical protein
MIQGRTQEEWIEQIQTPADRAAEPPRTIDCGPATAAYQTAPLPDGRYAIRFSCQMRAGAGMTVPWRVFPTREGCLSYFRSEVAAHFEREGTLEKGREQARRQMMGLLTSMFFEEPEARA